MKALPLCLATLALGCAPAAEPPLIFRQGTKLTRLDRGALGRKLTPRRLTVLDPYERRPIEFEGFLAREVLDLGLGPGWRAEEELLMTCLDGYRPSVPARRFVLHEALLAFRRLDQRRFTLRKGDVAPPVTVELGPYYLVWENQHDAAVRAEGDFGWPYQLVGLEPVRFVDRFPRLAPAADAAPAVQAGFLAWRVHCQKCHPLNGEGGTIGPELNRPMNVTEYWQPGPLRQWILDPASIRLPSRMPPLSPWLPRRSEVVDEILTYLGAMRDRKEP